MKYMVQINNVSEVELNRLKAIFYDRKILTYKEETDSCLKKSDGTSTCNICGSPECLEPNSKH